MKKDYESRKARKEQRREDFREDFKRGRSDFYVIPGDIFWDDDLEAAEMRLLVFIARMDNDPDRGCFGSNTYLAAFCNCSEKTVSRYIAHFIERGFLRAVYRDEERNLFVTDEYKSLLKGRYPQPSTPMDNLSTPGRHRVRKAGQIVHQYKDDVSEDVYRGCPKHAPNGAPEPNHHRNLPAYGEIPVEIREQAEARVLSRKPCPSKRSGPVWEDLIRLESAALMEETR